jgi:hypothetical protein
VNVAVVPPDETVPLTTPLGSLRLNVALEREAPFTAVEKVTFTAVTGLTVTAPLAGLVETTATPEIGCGVTGTGVDPGLVPVRSPRSTETGCVSRLSPTVVLPPHPARRPIRKRCTRPHRAARVRRWWVNERMA